MHSPRAANPVLGLSLASGLLSGCPTRSSSPSTLGEDSLDVLKRRLTETLSSAALDRPDRLREGCAIRLTRGSDGAIVGDTAAQSCTSTRPGAPSSTSESGIGPERLTSRERGGVEPGSQAQGATQGAPAFAKLSTGAADRKT